jgi:ribose 5-phosphate isomerase RpiB
MEQTEDSVIILILHPVATDVKEDFGIVICGSGNGITMTMLNT